MKRLLIRMSVQRPILLVEKYGNFEHWAKAAIGETKLMVGFHDGIHEQFPKLARRRDYHGLTRSNPAITLDEKARNRHTASG